MPVRKPLTANAQKSLPETRRLLHLPEAKAVLRLAAPISGVALLNMGMSVTDTVMMGWMGPQALAAGAVVSDVHSLVFYFVSGVAGAVTPIVAQHVGAGRWLEAGRTIQGGIVAAAILAPFTFLAVWNAAEILGVVGVAPAVVAMGRPYAQAIAFAAAAMLFVTVLKQMYDAMGRPKVFLTAVALALPSNAIANLVLMFGFGPIPAFGLAGAGIGSALVAAALLVGLAAYGASSRTTRRLELLASLPHLDPALVWEIFRIGVPIGIFMLGEVGIFLLSTIAVSLFGVDALAAHAITLRIAGVIYAIPVGLNQATTIRVGTMLGLGESGPFQRSMRTARVMGAIAGLALCLSLAAAALTLSLYASNAAQVIPRTVASLLLLLAILNLAQGFVAPVTGIMRALRETRVPMAAALIGYWIVGMPVGLAAAFGAEMGVFGIWIGLSLGVVATASFVNWKLARK